MAHSPLSKEFFKPGRVSVVQDGSFGSSGKGKMSSFLGERSNDWSFACHAFMSNAAHTVVSDRGTFGYQCLSSVSYLTDKYEKTYICGGAVIEMEPLLREIRENGVTPAKLGIHPLVAVVTQRDIDYERGVGTFEGQPTDLTVNETLTLGSTLHGVGAARARRILRRKDALLARDVPELQPYLCDTRGEVTHRLDRGEAGLMEIAQGFSLGYMEDRFYPKTTSRNCTVAAALDDCGIPPFYLGNVLINFRTFSIRVNSDKWLDADGRVLKYGEAMEMQAAGQKVIHIKGDSGKCYEDQEELTWEEVTEIGGHSTPLYEVSTLTQNPRRVFTFSQENVREAIRYNRPPADSDVFLSLNFLNYQDPEFKGEMTQKTDAWLRENIPLEHMHRVRLLGYGAHTNETVEVNIV